MSVIDRLVDAANAHDVEAAAALIHPDYRSAQPAHPGRRFVGREQFRANWTAMFAGVPDFRMELLRSVEDGATVWSEWAWSGTRTDGAPLEMRGVTLFEVEGDLITAGTLYMEDLEQEDVGIDETVQKLSGRRPERR